MRCKSQNGWRLEILGAIGRRVQRMQNSKVLGGSSLRHSLVLICGIDCIGRWMKQQFINLNNFRPSQFMFVSSRREIVPWPEKKSSDRMRDLSLGHLIYYFSLNRKVRVK